MRQSCLAPRDNGRWVEARLALWGDGVTGREGFIQGTVDGIFVGLSQLATVAAGHPARFTMMVAGCAGLAAVGFITLNHGIGVHSARTMVARTTLLIHHGLLHKSSA